MQGTITKGLEILAAGLAPYVKDRLRDHLGEDWATAASVARTVDSTDDSEWDAQIVLMLMWENWNQVFRRELSFVERSLVSELRESRNRWAHQFHFDSRDTYRCIDGIQRLLKAAKSTEAEAADRLRRRTLSLLHDDELLETGPVARDWFTGLISVACGALIVCVLLAYLQQPLSSVLAVLTTVVFSRIVFQTTRPRLVVNGGPRHCGNCARVFYGGSCPYCQQSRHLQSDKRAQPVAESVT